LLTIRRRRKKARFLNSLSNKKKPGFFVDKTEATPDP
jgi:hypothetical protein